MWVRLLKPQGKKGKYKIGQALKVVNALAREWIGQHKAIEYTGGFPIKKMKTEFFKPK